MRLGLLGGTFDPIHLGHLILAEQARDQLRLDRLLLIPAARPPHKPDRPITPYSLRLELTRAAADPVPGFEVSELERTDASPSYTVDTLARLRTQLDPTTAVWLILGEDSLREIPTWREPARIFELAHLAVLARPGESAPTAIPAGAEVDWLEGARIRLSSSDIRRRVRDGRSIRFLVPDSVRELIQRHRLYRDSAPI